MHVTNTCACLVLAAVMTPSALGDIIWDEAVDGDLSGDRFSPTLLGALGIGVHTIIATSVEGDLEYLTITLAPGVQLQSLILESYDGPSVSFIAVQEGTIFTEDPDTVNPANLLGWAHFGMGLDQLGTDILDDIGEGFGAIGFTPPLLPGDYTFWIQEINLPAVTYSMSFIVVPAPSAAMLLGIAGAWPRRRRPG